MAPTHNEANQLILPKLFTAPTQTEPGVTGHDASEVNSNPMKSIVESIPSNAMQLILNDVRYFTEKAKNMNDAQKLELIHNVLKPDLGPSLFVDQLMVELKRLEDYSWLCYFPSLNGALICLPCVLFGDQFPNKNKKVKKLFSEPMIYWPDASACFKRHVGLSSKAVRVGFYQSTYNKFLSLIG